MMHRPPDSFSYLTPEITTIIAGKLDPKSQQNFRCVETFTKAIVTAKIHEEMIKNYERFLSLVTVSLKGKLSPAEELKIGSFLRIKEEIVNSDSCNFRNHFFEINFYLIEIIIKHCNKNDIRAFRNSCVAEHITIPIFRSKEDLLHYAEVYRNKYEAMCQENRRESLSTILCKDVRGNTDILFNIFTCFRVIENRLAQRKNEVAIFLFDILYLSPHIEINDFYTKVLEDFGQVIINISDENSKTEIIEDILKRGQCTQKIILPRGVGSIVRNVLKKIISTILSPELQELQMNRVNDFFTTADLELLNQPIKAVRPYSYYCLRAGHRFDRL